MLDIILAVLFGISIGIVTGLLPGLHPNTLIPMVLSLTALFDPLTMSVILVSAGISNSFVNFIPSILLGAPEADSALSVLPGHKLLLEGRGYEAIKLTVIGGLGAVVFAVLSLPLFGLFVPNLYNFLRPQLWWILTLVIVYMILSEKKGTKRFAVITMLFSGILGIIVLNNFDSSMLFPMLSGLFGIPLLMLSIGQKVSMPENFNFEETPMPKYSKFLSVITGAVAGVIVGLLPGVGSSQAAVLAQQTTDRSSPEMAVRKFLIAIGGVNMSDFVYSLLALWIIGNPRSGIAVAVGQLITLDANVIMILIASILVAAGFSAYVTIRMSRKIMPVFRRLNYTRLCVATAVFITLLVFLFSGPLGIFVLAVSSAVGLIPNISGVKKSHAMGCLLIPTILFFAAL